MQAHSGRIYIRKRKDMERRCEICNVDLSCNSTTPSCQKVIGTRAALKTSIIEVARKNFALVVFPGHVLRRNDKRAARRRQGAQHPSNLCPCPAVCEHGFNASNSFSSLRTSLPLPLVLLPQISQFTCITTPSTFSKA